METNKACTVFKPLGRFHNVTFFDSKHIFCVEESFHSVTALQFPQMLAVCDYTATNYQEWVIGGGGEHGLDTDEGHQC